MAKLLLSDRNRKACIIRYYHVMLQETLAEDINHDVLAIGKTSTNNVEGGRSFG